MEICEHLDKPTEQNSQFIDHPKWWPVVTKRIKRLSLPQTSEVRILDLPAASAAADKSFLPGAAPL